MDSVDLLMLGAGCVFGVALRPRLARVVRRLRPRPRSDSAEQGWRAEQLRALDESARDDARIVMYGDSLLHAFELSEWFPDAQLEVVNRAIAGDRTEHLAARIARSAPRARCAIVLIGCNDLLHDGIAREPAEVARRVLALCRELESVEELLLVSLLPVSDPGQARRVQATNALLAGAAAQGSWRFVDAHSSLADVEGRLSAGSTVDGVHLSVAGMALLAGSLAAACPALGPEGSLMLGAAGVWGRTERRRVGGAVVEGRRTGQKGREEPRPRGVSQMVSDGAMKHNNKNKFV